MTSTVVGVAQNAANLGGYARQLDAVVNVAVINPPAGTTIAFPINPSVDLAPINGYTPTTTNLFIAVYEPKLGLWVPLPTTYEAASKSITAIAPHFSLFSTWVVDATGDVEEGGKIIAGGLVTGLKAFDHWAASAVSDELKSWLDLPPQHKMECSQPDPTWGATITESRFRTCLQKKNWRRPTADREHNPIAA